jgi:membrane protein DedA with SNARE-associated domain
VCDDRNDDRAEISALMALATSLVVGLFHLHIHLQHHFRGPPIDYVGLAAASAASWFGFPGPGEPILIAAGVLAAQHKLDLASVLVVSWAAATAGGIGGWLLGLKAGRAFVTAPGPLRRLRIRAVDRGEAVFERYPVIAIILTPAWVAGINRVRPTVYLITNALTAIVWAVGIGLGSYFIGPSVVDAVNDLGTFTAVSLGTLVLAGVAIEVARRRRSRPTGSPTGGP